MLKRNGLPLALCGLAVVLIMLSVSRYLDDGTIDAFSTIVAVLTLGLGLLVLFQKSED